MKKYFSLSFLFLLMGAMVTSCKGTSANQKESNVLRIYNWQDYIFEGDDENDSVIDQFIDYYYETYGERIEVEYYTFETND